MNSTKTYPATNAGRDHQYQQAIRALESTLSQIKGCPPEERDQLLKDVSQLEEMYQKVTRGRVEIVIFGEISTGKSALINALIGREVVSVDVQGGWTKKVWGTKWEGAGHRLAGLEDSELVLIDTPGINEVGGADRAELAEVTARKADLILFVCDSDLNETEFVALVELAAVRKPMILVLNKMDLYSATERDSLVQMLKQRTTQVLPDAPLVMTSADPRAVEYVIEQSDGSTVSQWRKPAPDIEPLKVLILEILDREGLGLLALNAALYAADKSDRISALRVQMRNRQADQVIWGMAATKAVVVACNPLPWFDVLGGLAVDALMIVSLSHVYGLSLSIAQARGLAKSIASAAGVFALGELTSWGASLLKGLTLSFSTPISLIPQGAAVGFTTYIVGKAAKRYFEHGGSWGADSAKQVVTDILNNTDRDSVISRLKDEIRQKLTVNRYAK